MRSKFEKEVAKYLKQNKVKFEYEPKDKIVNYQIPVTNHKYTPDFVIDGVMYETKGYIRSVAERRKYVYVAEQNPDLKLVMVFQNPNLPIRKGSKTTYKTWFEKNGIQTMSIKEFKKKYENKTKSTK
ncbi:MAG TPA: hypothetical protein VK031_02220 [Tissierellaceae bacterium]|nr:hypothetical protein [Tissierellaceae bacterium]